MAKLVAEKKDWTTFVLGTDPETGAKFTVDDLNELQAKNHLCSAICLIRRLQNNANKDWTMIMQSCYHGGEIGDDNGN